MKSKPFAVLILFTTVAFLSYSEPMVHELAKGETLYSLARRYDVSLESLLQENHIENPAGLQIGTQLLIPGKVSKNVSISAPSISAGAATEKYRVTKGDTYYSIAKSYGMNVNSLLELNGRAASRILRVGETLVVSKRVSENPVDILPVSAEPVSVGKVERVEKVPWWPVAGLKRPLDGKLAGVAIETEASSYVYAVSAGTVVWTGPYRGFGNVVLVDSQGYIYLYGGNKDLFVNVGQSISAGSRIGRLEDSGPQLGLQRMIFSVFRDGVPIPTDKAPRG